MKINKTITEVLNWEFHKNSAEAIIDNNEFKRITIKRNSDQKITFHDIYEIKTVHQILSDLLKHVDEVTPKKDIPTAELKGDVIEVKQKFYDILVDKLGIDINDITLETNIMN